MLTDEQIDDLAEMIATLSLLSEVVKAEMAWGTSPQGSGTQVRPRAWEERLPTKWEERLKEVIARLLKFARDVGPDNVTVSVKPLGVGLDMTWALKTAGH